MRRTAEFDAFGPWTDEVRTRDDLPRLYRRSGIDPAVHHLVLKVPRDIDRRNATPDMNLYDFLLAVDDDSLTVLHRQDGSGGEYYRTARIPAHQITALENSTNLLDGRLVVHTFAGSTTISYNASDPQPIRKLVQFLRRLYLPAPAHPVPPGTPVTAPDLGAKDLNLASACEKLLRAEPGMRLIDAARRGAAVPAGGWTDRAVHLLRPMTLHAALTLAGPGEIALLHRRERLGHGKDDGRSIARTFLPRPRITDVHVHPHEKYRQINIVTIILGSSSLGFPVRAGATTDALLNLCTTATGAT